MGIGRMNLVSQQEPGYVSKARIEVEACWKEHDQASEAYEETEGEARDQAVERLHSTTNRALAAEGNYRKAWTRWQAALAVVLAPVMEDVESDYSYIQDNTIEVVA